ncbi:MAG: vWA domain-containing protein [Steroidobacteraceae bacterium]
MTTPSLCLTPRRSALLAEHDNTLEVLVRIQAPDAPAGEVPARQPLNIGLVIDRSGSMSGPPLREAIRCANFVIDSLTPEDQASVVVYDDSVHTLVPTTSVTDRDRFRRALSTVHSGGSTDLHGGWLRGAETLAPLAEGKALSRVILLSDGCANHGLTDLLEITAQCTALAEAGVGTSTYGLGDGFNEELMVAMARAGQGNNYYGQTAEDLMDPFREEFALLNALCGRKLVLELKAPSGVKLEMLNDYDMLEPGRWRLPDLAYGAEAWALVQLKLSAKQVEKLGGQVPGTLLTASVRYEDRGGEPRAIQPRTLSLSSLPAAAFGAVAEDDLVKRRADELTAADIQKKARKAAMAGDWRYVDRYIERLKGLGKDNAWIEAVTAELRELAERRDQARFAKESMYSAHRMSRRLASRMEGEFAPGEDVPDYVRRKMAQGKRDPKDLR